jgi:hypothetical protein
MNTFLLILGIILTSVAGLYILLVYILDVKYKL